MELLRKNAVPLAQWPEIIEEMKRYSKAIGMGFEGSTAYTSGNYVLVDSQNDLCFEMLRKQANRDRMREIIRRLTGQEYKLGRYSYPDETKPDDPLSQFVADLQAAGVPVEDSKKTSDGTS